MLIRFCFAQQCIYIVYTYFSCHNFQTHRRCFKGENVFKNKSVHLKIKIIKRFLIFGNDYYSRFKRLLLQNPEKIGMTTVNNITMYAEQFRWNSWLRFLLFPRSTTTRTVMIIPGSPGKENGIFWPH